MPNTYSIIMAFVDPSDDHRIRTVLRETQVNGATILYGRGTVRNPLFNLMGLDNPRKEILIIVTENNNCDNIVQHFYDNLHMERHGRGLCIALPITRVYGLRTQDEIGYSTAADIATCDPDSDHELIVTIVNNGRAEEVLKAAYNAGATGATVLHGRGSGIHKVEKFFHLEIEPEKEVVVIIADCSTTEPILNSIRSAMDFNRPNSGILFTLDITSVVGLVANS